MTNKEMIEVIQAWDDGKKLQYRLKSEKSQLWKDCAMPIWNFNWYDYRVAPEPVMLWVNLYEDTPEYVPCGYTSRSAADKAASPLRTRCIRMVEVVE